MSDPPPSAADPPDLAPFVEEAVAAWSLPALRQVPLHFSGRLRTSLGLFDPRRNEVRLARFLVHGGPALLREVVLHELAHAAVRHVHGRGARPHGREWQGFMRAVDLPPRVRFPRELLQRLHAADPVLRAARPRDRWRHVCPRCNAAVIAGRPMRRWRCRVCLAAGEDGVLTIERWPVRGAAQGAGASDAEAGCG